MGRKAEKTTTPLAAEPSPQDKTQRAKSGTKNGLLRRGEVIGPDFKKIVRASRELSASGFN
jgi:hypothetical protein